VTKLPKESEDEFSVNVAPEADLNFSAKFINNIEKKPYKKYDDEAFKKDLEKYQDRDSRYIHRDELDVKQIIKTALQVEDESKRLKSKHTGTKYDSLYQD
jgi:hypothetical protein